MFVASVVMLALNGVMALSFEAVNCG